MQGVMQWNKVLALTPCLRSTLRTAHVTPVFMRRKQDAHLLSLTPVLTHACVYKPVSQGFMFSRLSAEWGWLVFAQLWGPFPIPSCLIELRGKFLIKRSISRKWEILSTWKWRDSRGVCHISAACVDKTGGWGQVQRGVGREGTWVVFAQSDSVDQELIKAFVDYWSE